MTKISDKQIEQGAKILGIALLVVVAIIAATYGLKTIRNILGLTDQKAEEKANKEKAAELEANTKTEKKAVEKKGIKATLTGSQAAAIANAVYNDLNKSGVSKDRTDAFNQLAKILNDADFLNVQSAFGIKQDYAFGFPVGDKLDFVSFVRSNLSSAYIEPLNAMYSKSKMRYKF